MKNDIKKTRSTKCSLTSKVFYNKAYLNLCLSQACSTVSSAGYQANNVNASENVDDTLFDQAIQEEVGSLEAIANLATVSASDKSTIATLTVTNATLTSTNSTLAKEIIFL